MKLSLSYANKIISYAEIHIEIDVYRFIIANQLLS